VQRTSAFFPYLTDFKYIPLAALHANMREMCLKRLERLFLVRLKLLLLVVGAI
jgi:hypothetical protein